MATAISVARARLDRNDVSASSGGARTGRLMEPRSRVNLRDCREASGSYDEHIWSIVLARKDGTPSCPGYAASGR